MKPGKGRIVSAAFLILIGVWFLVVELIPAVKDFAYGPQTWPWQIIGLAGLFLLAGLLSWTPGLFIPASILGGIGALLYYQNSTGNWASWAYAWTLIPAFVGVGLLLFGLATRRRGALAGALWTFFASAIAFGIFGSFLGGGQLAALAWPAALIVVGLYFIVRAFFRRPTQ